MKKVKNIKPIKVSKKQIDFMKIFERNMLMASLLTGKTTCDSILAELEKNETMKKEFISWFGAIKTSDLVEMFGPNFRNDN